MNDPYWFLVGVGIGIASVLATGILKRISQPTTPPDHRAPYPLPLLQPGTDYVERWIGFHLDSKGNLSADIWDHNPGSLAHVYRYRIPVPPEVQDHFLQHRECLLLDKFGRAKGPCESSPAPITGQPPTMGLIGNA